MTSQKDTQPSTLAPWTTGNNNLMQPIKGVGEDRAKQSAQNQLWAGTFGNGGGKKRYKSVKRYRRCLNKNRKTKKFRKRKSYNRKVKRKSNRKTKRKKIKKNIKKVYFGGTDQCNKKHSGDTVNDQRNIGISRQPALTNITDPPWSNYGYHHFADKSTRSQVGSDRGLKMLNAYNNTTNNNPMCPD